MHARNQVPGRDSSGAPDEEVIRLRIHGNTDRPTLVYLPGLHGDWTLLAPFRAALAGRARLVEFAYPRRPDWRLPDYAGAIEAALAGQDIRRTWLLGESFSSQVAWQLLANQGGRQSAGVPLFAGLILVGGFIRHPWPWGVWFAHQASRTVPMWLLQRACKFYGQIAGRQSCDCPDLATDLQEFVQRRTTETDRAAITARYRLISGNDLRPVAQHCRVPVYQLSGAIDPIVPWWHVRPWLRRHCPGYRGSRIIGRASHNVLLSAPRESAGQILDWVSLPGETSAIK